MIDAYYWPTPNGWKITIALEELGADYTIVPVNIYAGGQFGEKFLSISPNNRMPAIVDHSPKDGSGDVSVFESGAILVYLAEKYGALLPSGGQPRADVISWLMWQMGGLGPMVGQAGHFHFYAPEQIEYAKTRYFSEMLRLYGVLDRRLDGREYVVDDYSIADIAIWPWIVTYKRLGVEIDKFPNVKRWYKSLQGRPALRKGYDVGRDWQRPTGTWTDEERRILMAQADPAGRHTKQS